MDRQTLVAHPYPPVLLTLFLLGDLRLEHDGSTLLAGRRKPLALLAFLARRGSRSSAREELASLLWGGGDDASARKSLRQCLSDLRAVDGLSFIESEAGLTLAPGALSTDVDRFEADIRASNWKSAIERWRGDVMPAVESLGGASWQHWLDGERIAVRRQVALACDHLTISAERAGEWAQAIDAAARWRSILPGDSRGWCREIHALQAAGRIPDAIARVGEGERYFRNELGTSVPHDLARLSRVLARVGQVAGTPAASLLTSDLLGRAGPMESLARSRIAARLGGNGRAVLVIAAEGLGKTRLTREFARSTRDADSEALVIEVSANPSDRARPWSFLQGVVAPLASHDALAGCAPETLAALADVAPALRAHFRHLPPSDGTGDRHAALRSSLEEVARRSTVVLVLDDLPDADDQSQSIIASMIQSPVTGVLVVATGRPESWQASTSLSALPARADRCEHCSVEPLDLDETRAVLSSMAPLAHAAVDALATPLHRLSGGNPGLLISAMTTLVVTRVLEPDGTGMWSLGSGNQVPVVVPPVVEERWRARYGEMSADARAVVDAAAILCRTAPEGKTGMRDLENVAGLDAHRFGTSLEYLRRCGVVRVHGTSVTFTAGFFAQLAYQGLVPSRRSALHARAARPGRRRRIAAMLVGLIVLASGGWFVGKWNGSRLPPRTPVLLADVLNLTGDSTFDQALYVAASVGLQQSRQVSLFPRSRVRQTLALMQRPGADSVLDEVLAREIAVRENLRRVVQLSVARLDDNYLLTGRVIDPSSGADVYSHQERAGGRDDVLAALDRVLTRLRRGVGESRDTLRAFSVPLPRVTTGSLPALQSYATALRAFNARRYGDARDAYVRAVALDSSFALAWLGLAELHYQLFNDRHAGDSALARAERHDDRLSERERMRLAQSSAGYRGNADEELRMAEALARNYPELQTWYNLGTMLMRRRRCPEALTSFENALGVDSTFVPAHLNVATCHQFLGASDRAVAAYHRAWTVDSLAVYQGGLNHEFGVALVRAGQPDSARAVYGRMARRPLSQDRQFGHRSLAYHGAWTGHWRIADAQFDSAAMVAREANTLLSEFRNRILQSEHRLTADLPAQARQSLDMAWALRERIVIDPAFAMYAGLAFVRGGQLNRAAGMLRIIDESIRQASGGDRTLRAILAARVALAERRPDAARRELASATDTTRSDYILPALVDAYLALGHPDSALAVATRFEERVVFGIDAQDAWLRNLLVKAQIAEQLGRREVATTAYARLKAQLSAGDADHPLLVESRRGLARLAVGDARR